MSDLPSRQRWHGLWLATLAFVVLGTTAAGAIFYWSRPNPDESPRVYHNPQRAYASGIQIQYFCGRCHAYPHPDILPRSAWKEEVEQAYKFFETSAIAKTMQPPALEHTLKYYQDGASEELPLPPLQRAGGPSPVGFEPMPCPAAPDLATPAIANVNLVRLFDATRLDILACDMRAGLVLALSPYADKPSWRVLAKLANPAHAEVVDLDGDGIRDILVADLGSAKPTDDRVGRVIWLRGDRDGGFTPITLLEGVGRVADVQAADFRGLGKLDLVVAVFGWRNTGEVVYLENQTKDWSRPVFTPRVFDDRHGAIHVPVSDINGDGKLDFVALFSQEHETVVAFLSDGEGQFRKETIWAAPHPAYGSTGIQLVDLNGDGKLDVLYTNGDSMDKPYVLKPYHGVQWLENRDRFPFEHRAIATMYGVHRAVAADFRGVGKLDIVAVSSLPEQFFPKRQELDAVIYLEQTAPGEFARHTLAKGTCDHPTCAAGDVFGRGRIDVVVGTLVREKPGPALTILSTSKR